MISHRRPLAWLLFVALLFAQVANAAHACAREVSMASDEFAALSIAEKPSGPATDCEEMRTAAIDRGASSSPLCVDHCVHATQASADTPASVLHWLPAPLPGVFLVVPPIAHAFDSLAFSEAPGMGRPITPAIPILLGRFLS